MVVKISHRRKIRRFFPFHLETLGSQDSLFLALGNDTDEITLVKNMDRFRHIPQRFFIHGDEFGIYTWRTYHASMEHARDAQVLNEGRLACYFEWQIKAGDGCTNEMVFIMALDGTLIRNPSIERFSADQSCISRITIRFSMNRNISIIDHELGYGRVQFNGSLLKKETTCLGCSLTQCAAASLDRHATGSVSFVRCAIGIPHHHTDAVHRHIQFFRDNLCQSSQGSGTEFHLTTEGCDHPIGIDRQPLVALISRSAAPGGLSASRSISGGLALRSH